MNDRPVKPRKSHGVVLNLSSKYLPRYSAMIIGIANSALTFIKLKRLSLHHGTSIPLFFSFSFIEKKRLKALCVCMESNHGPLSYQDSVLPLNYTRNNTKKSILKFKKNRRIIAKNPLFCKQKPHNLSNVGFLVLDKLIIFENYLLGALP